jgi:hypothetical protein
MQLRRLKLEWRLWDDVCCWKEKKIKQKQIKDREEIKSLFDYFEFKMPNVSKKNYVLLYLKRNKKQSLNSFFMLQSKL